MSIWVLLQIIVNIFVLVGVVVCLVKTFKTKEDDSRLTQGLRLLQSKISILEDLSDHTENQVQQLMTLLDKKLIEVRKTIQHMNVQINEVDRSIEQGKKMAQAIQHEMASDQMTEKKLESRYIQAAQLAHQGLGVEEIMQQVELPRGEVELITKVNRKKCVYQNSKTSKGSYQKEILSRSLEMPDITTNSVDKAQIDFQEAVQNHNDQSGFRSVKLG